MDTEHSLFTQQQQVLAIAKVVAFTAVSGIADALGFIHSTRAWHDGAIRWPSLGTGAGFFAVGLITYWFASYQLSALGVGAPEMQALFWFFMTIVGLGLLSGQFSSWPALDQLLALCVVTGLGTLMVRVG